MGQQNQNDVQRMKVGEEESLEDQIERVRTELENLIRKKNYNLVDPSVIAKSQALDALLNLMQKGSI